MNWKIIPIFAVLFLLLIPFAQAGKPDKNMKAFPSGADDFIMYSTTFLRSLNLTIKDLTITGVLNAQEVHIVNTTVENINSTGDVNGTDGWFTNIWEDGINISAKYVPYTGASQHIDLGIYSITTTGLGQFGEFGVSSGSIGDVAGGYFEDGTYQVYLADGTQAAYFQNGGGSVTLVDDTYAYNDGTLNIDYQGNLHTDSNISTGILNATIILEDGQNISDKYYWRDGSFPMIGDVLPSASNTYDLGNKDQRWERLYVDRIYDQNDDFLMTFLPSGGTSQVTLYADRFIPGGVQSDLGAHANPWRDLYLSGTFSDSVNNVTIEEINTIIDTFNFSEGITLASVWVGEGHPSSNASTEGETYGTTYATNVSGDYSDTWVDDGTSENIRINVDEGNFLWDYTFSTGYNESSNPSLFIIVTVDIRSAENTDMSIWNFETSAFDPIRTGINTGALYDTYTTRIQYPTYNLSNYINSTGHVRISFNDSLRFSGDRFFIDFISVNVTGRDINLTLNYGVANEYVDTLCWSFYGEPRAFCIGNKTIIGSLITVIGGLNITENATINEALTLGTATADNLAPGDLGMSGNLIVGEGVPDTKATIYQSSDTDGITIYGFDDHVADNLKLYVNEFGSATMEGSDEFKFTSGAGTIVFDPETSVRFNRLAKGNATFFDTVVEARNLGYLTISGFQTGSGGRKTMSIGVEKPTYDTASFEGVSNYLFDGNLNASGTGTFGDLEINNTNIVVDTVNNRVCINCATPSYTLHVAGTTRSSDYRTSSNDYFGFGLIETKKMRSTSGDNYGKLELSRDTGASITRNRADGATVFNISNFHENSTGDILNVNNNDSLVFNISRDGNASFLKNVIAENIWLPTYCFAHTDDTQNVTTGGIWYNVSFDDEASLCTHMTHTYSDSTNDTFIIQDDGIYDVTYHMTFSDTAPLPTGHIEIRIVRNDTEELSGSLLEEDSSKQYNDFTIGNGGIFKLGKDDEIMFQFTADDTTIGMSSHSQYGEHQDTGVIKFRRIG